METQIYKVRDPSGALREISGPVGASDEDVIAKAKELFSGQSAVKPAPTFGAPPNFFERQLAKFPDIPGASKGGPIDTFVRGMADPSIPANALGNKVTDVASDLGASPNVAGGAGYLANVGVQAAPMLLGGISRTAAPLFDWTANRLMGSALNAPLKYRLNGASERAARTMLDEGVNVSERGVDRLTQLGMAARNDANAAINSSTATIDKGVVGNRLQPVISEIERSNPTPNTARATVEGIYNQYMSNPLIPQNIPVRQAQDLKQGLYRLIDERFGQIANDTNVTAAQKALARGFKEELEAAVPAVVAPNATQSQLWNAQKLARQAVAKNQGSAILGFSPVAHGPSGFVAMLLDKNALLKSLSARALHSGQEAIPFAAAEGGIGAISAAQSSAQNRRKGILSMDDPVQRRTGLLNTQE